MAASTRDGGAAREPSRRAGVPRAGAVSAGAGAGAGTGAGAAGAGAAGAAGAGAAGAGSAAWRAGARGASRHPPGIRAPGASPSREGASPRPRPCQPPSTRSVRGRSKVRDKTLRVVPSRRHAARGSPTRWAESRIPSPQPPIPNPRRRRLKPPQGPSLGPRVGPRAAWGPSACPTEWNGRWNDKPRCDAIAATHGSAIGPS